MEVRHFIVEAEKNYFDPRLFRINLNACIQALRSVTFVLQAQKNKVRDFELWYAPWQEHLRSDGLLKWLVSARNRVVKQGDLELHSVLRVGLLAAYYDAPQFDYAMPLRFDFKKILHAIKLESLPPDVFKNAYLRLERRWVANDLPERELMDVVEYGYTTVDAVVRDLSRYLEGRPNPIVAPPSPSTDRLLSPRIMLMRLADGSVVGGIDSRTIESKPSDEAEMLQRYGMPNTSARDPGGVRDLREIANTWMDYAVAVLRKDGYHQTIATLISEKGVRIVGVNVRDDAEKYIVWRNIADEVRRSGVDTVIIVGETWTANIDPKFPYRRAVDSPEKGEALSVLAASKSGEQVDLLRKFKRTDAGIEFEEVEEQKDMQAFMIEPIREVWGLPKYASPKDDRR